MSERIHFFRTPQRWTAVALPFDLDVVVGEWTALRQIMVKRHPDAFTRDEWAYLIAFLDRPSLMLPFLHSFGAPDHAADARAGYLARPRGGVAVWLPNNVSLLGPLTLILLSLTGNPLRMKEGSQSQNLTGAFLEFARHSLPSGALATWLSESVRIEAFDRQDPRNLEMAAAASMRIVFGSDDTVAAVDALPHPVDSIGIAFADRQSEAWLEAPVLDEATLTTLIRVSAIYGQAGCTSPRRLVLLDADLAQARALRDRLLGLWSAVIRSLPSMHVASSNVMARQLAAAQGWDARLTANNAAVLAVGDAGLPPFSAPMGWSVIPASLDEALSHLPTNVQTVGHALVDPGDPRWLSCVARSSIKRFVPVARMHHFGPVWDGWAFWHQAFEEVEMSR